MADAHEELCAALERAARRMWSENSYPHAGHAGPVLAVQNSRNIFAGHGKRLGSSWKVDKWTRVDAITAALFLLCHALPKTRATCPTCKGSTHVLDEGPFVDPALASRARSYFLRFVGVWNGRNGCRVLLGGCPDCRPPEPPSDKDGEVMLHWPARGWIMRSQASLLLGALPENSNADDRSALSVMSDDLIANGRCKSSCVICNGAGCVTASGRLLTDTERLERMHPAANGWTIRYTGDSWQAKRTCPQTQQKQALGEWLALWLASLPPISANDSQANPDALDCRSALAACIPAIIDALDKL